MAQTFTPRFSNEYDEGQERANSVREVDRALNPAAITGVPNKLHAIMKGRGNKDTEVQVSHILARAAGRGMFDKELGIADGNRPDALGLALIMSKYVEIGRAGMGRGELIEAIEAIPVLSKHRRDEREAE